MEEDVQEVGVLLENNADQQGVQAQLGHASAARFCLLANRRIPDGASRLANGPMGKNHWPRNKSLAVSPTEPRHSNGNCQIHQEYCRTLPSNILTH